MFEVLVSPQPALSGRSLQGAEDLAELVMALAALDGGPGLTDAERITQLDALERVKAACAAAQARITTQFVESQAQEASDWWAPGRGVLGQGRLRGLAGGAGAGAPGGVRARTDGAGGEGTPPGAAGWRGGPGRTGEA